MQATLTINLANIIKNYESIKKFVGPKVQVAPVFKCNAYGLGMEPIAKVLYKSGCREFYVARLQEALKLRNILKTAEIYVLDGVFSGEEESFLKSKTVPVLNNLFQINLWEQYAKQLNKTLNCCVHIDSGMTRLGIDCHLVDEVFKQIVCTKHLKVQYVISHLACADHPASPMNAKQLNFIQALKTKYPKFKYSLANSAGTMLGKNYHLDQVRPGIAIYGGSPLKHECKIKLYPAITLDSQIIDIHIVKDKKTQTSVGYGATHKLHLGNIIATVPIGYGDGFFRRLGNKGYCFINTHKVHIVGRISMDLLCIDISQIPTRFQKVGQTVEIIGKHISIEEIASLADTINYEVLTSLGNRYERNYAYK